MSAKCERKIGSSKGALVTPSPLLLAFYTIFKELAFENKRSNEARKSIDPSERVPFVETNLPRRVNSHVRTSSCNISLRHCPRPIFLCVRSLRFCPYISLLQVPATRPLVCAATCRSDMTLQHVNVEPYFTI